MNLTQAMAIFWSRRFTIVAVFVAAMIAAVLAAMTMKSQYTARAQLFVNLSEPNAATDARCPEPSSAATSARRSRPCEAGGLPWSVAVAEGLVKDPELISAFRRATEDAPASDIADWIGALTAEFARGVAPGSERCDRRLLQER